MSYQRHTLCYLKSDAKPLASTDDTLLAYWIKQQFPLIYTHQPLHLGSMQVKLAIPYFDQVTQQKIRRSFLFSPTSISYSKALPELTELFPDLKHTTNTLMRAFGSYCWQYITQHHYVQSSSDLDVQISYTAESLTELTQLYSYLKDALPIKSLDGEIHFPNMGDCSWIELIQQGSCGTLLLKSEHQIRLVPREELYATFPALIASS